MLNIKLINRYLARIRYLWLQGNNSGCPKTLARTQEEQTKLVNRVTKILKAYDIDIDWPGLHATFTYGGVCYQNLEQVPYRIKNHIYTK